MFADNASGHGTGSQAVHTPYILYILTNIQACEATKFHHLTYLREARFT